MLKKSIQVLIVDDHALVRRGLSVFLEEFEDFELAGEAENGQEAVELAAQLQPDVVLMDLIMPVMDGVSATRIIRQKSPHIAVIVLTSAPDPHLLQQAREAGAQETLTKNVTFNQLEQAIRAAVE